ncbi:MAG TPA: hypothetical protein VFC00_35185 [Micromonosporaceae bacterium]|nr:hypothetical protein [Micromonosporaceae bacterium]
MPAQTKNKLPAPLYAAAGASDIVYQQLRKVEFDKLSEFAQIAQERAMAVYRDLVARGERIVNGKPAVRTAPTPVDSTPAGVDAARPVKKATATK